MRVQVCHSSQLPVRVLLVQKAFLQWEGQKALLFALRSPFYRSNRPWKGEKALKNISIIFDVEVIWHVHICVQFFWAFKVGLARFLDQSGHRFWPQLPSDDQLRWAAASVQSRAHARVHGGALNEVAETVATRCNYCTIVASHIHILCLKKWQTLADIMQ